MSKESTNNENETPVALVTGGARRIGAAICQRLHADGFRVVIHYRSSATEAEQLAQTLNARRSASASIVQADLSQRKQRESLGSSALQAFGRMDALVNNASSFYPTALGESTEQQWDELFDSNVRAAWFLCQQLAPALRARHGNIINLTDINASRGMGGFGIYAMAKSALQGMTRSLARELAPEIRVNAVAPGAILWPEHLEDPGQHGEEQQRILSGIPAGRLGEPQDIAACVAFLITEAQYMTGQTIKVDGGRSLG